MNLKTQIRTIEKRLKQTTIPKQFCVSKLTILLKTWTEEELRQVADGGPIPESLKKRMEEAGIEYDE